MTRKVILIAAFCLLGSLAIAGDDEKKPPQAGKVDKSKIFEQMDADGDGKITKDEYKAFREKAAERLKDSGKGGNLAGRLDGIFDKLFEQMDADRDGKVTKEEFEKFQPAGGKIDPEKLKGLLDKIKKKDQ